MSDEKRASFDYVNEKLSIGKTTALGLQHVLAAYVGTVAVPFIIGGALHFNPAQITLLIAANLFIVGIGTIIQTMSLGKHIGMKLPVLLGTTITTAGPIIGIASTPGSSITDVYGAIIIGGALVFLIAPVFGKLMKFFPPVVTGSIVTIIGIALIPVGIAYSAGGFGSPNYGDPINLYIAAFTIIVILAVNKYCKGFIQSISLIIGLIAGTILAAFFGMVNVQPVIDAKWVSLIRPFAFGVPTFKIGAILTMSVTLIVVMLEGIGTFLAIGDICGKPTDTKQLTRGYRAEGVSTLLGVFFNSFPVTTYYTNLGLVIMTKIRSRYVVMVAGIFFVLLGCIPKFAALASIVPMPVMGGVMLVLLTMVGVAGIRMLQAVDFDNIGNMLVAVTSIGIGVGISVSPGLFAKFHPLFNTLFGSSGIVPGAIIAVVTNIFMNYKEIMKSGASDAKAGASETV